MSPSRIHKVLLALWDIARDHPRYDKRVWSELQLLINELETRNRLLRCVLTDLLGSTDDAGQISWEKTQCMSPPQGYAVKFMSEELRRERSEGTYQAFKQLNGLFDEPAPKQKIDFVIDLDDTDPSPGLADSSDELAIE